MAALISLCLSIIFFGLIFGCQPPGQSNQVGNGKFLMFEFFCDNFFLISYSKVRIGYDTYICVTIAPLIWPSNGSYVRMTSIAKADNFSSINIHKCTSLLNQYFVFSSHFWFGSYSLSFCLSLIIATILILVFHIKPQFVVPLNS